MLNVNVLDNLKTGDLILFESQNSGWLGCFDSIIKYFTQSQYTHIAMVILGADLLVPDIPENKIYLWESAYESQPDPISHKKPYGVRLTDLDLLIKDYQGKLYVRKLNSSLEKSNLLNPEKLTSIYQQIKNKPYDINIRDWYYAWAQNDKHRTNKSFFCSALVGYIYTQLGIFKTETDWSILRPSDFSIENQDVNLQYQGSVKLEDYQENLFSSSS